ncbi:ATP-grasp domain-containing protein [Paenibacillus sp. TC-CSREp1]|uniref:ATP-grasp domain-containing protein n=1 Tax=Paenibacillus sp. TC-CSREp1 TaxID=3410089 RepID=UPI003D020A97
MHAAGQKSFIVTQCAQMQRNQAEAVRNKWIMKQMLQQRGIRTSRTAIALQQQDYLRFSATYGFPIIVKPLSGYGSINTFKLSSMEELLHYLQYTRKEQQRDLLEEFIQGTESIVTPLCAGEKWFLLPFPSTSTTVWTLRRSRSLRPALHSPKVQKPM